MTNLMKLSVGFASLLSLGACEYLGFAQEYGARAAAEATRAECLLGPVVRQQNFCAIQDELARMQTPNRVSPLDCDGNGAPDDLGPCGVMLPE